MPPKANEAIDSLIDMEQYLAEPISTGATGPDMGQLLSNEALENEWTKFFLTTEYGDEPEAVEALMDMWRLYGEKSNLEIVTKDELKPGAKATFSRMDPARYHWLNKPDKMYLQKGDFYSFFEELAHGFQYAREPEERQFPIGKRIEDDILQRLAYGVSEGENPWEQTLYYPKLGLAAEEHNPQFTEDFISRQESDLSRAYYNLLSPFVQWHEYQPGITDESILPLEFEAHKSISPKLIEEWFNKYMENLSQEASPKTAKQYLEILMEE
jgi:hypothetical protein